MLVEAAPKLPLGDMVRSISRSDTDGSLSMQYHINFDKNPYHAFTLVTFSDLGSACRYHIRTIFAREIGA